MKKTLIILATIMLLTNCSVNNSDNIDIDANAIKYFKDYRTGICYAVTASRKSFDAHSTGLGLTCVPCDSVKHLIEN